MRLTCDVDIANRMLPSFNIRSKGKVCKAQLSVGRKPGEARDAEVYLMVATKQDRNGTRYRIKGNIEQLFGKFINEGKATIRLKEPPHDICLSKADPLQLKGFLSVVKLGHQGQGLEKVRLTSLAPVSAKQAENLKTKMTILKKADYPLTSNFPISLETLTVNHCTLKRFDGRMLRLRHLKCLDLCENSITSLPDNISDLECLHELKLTHNKLLELPKSFCLGRLKDKLSLLDVSHNQIKFLRPHIVEMSALVTFKVDNNEIAGLPPRFGNMKNLRIFTATNNQLQRLPRSFQQLQLDTLDLFGNPLSMASSAPVKNDRLQGKIVTLQELVARFLIVKRLPYPAEEIGPLIHYMESVKYCRCGRPCFDSHIHCVYPLNLHSVAASVTAVDVQGTVVVPADGFFCSRRCFSRFGGQNSVELMQIDH